MNVTQEDGTKTYPFVSVVGVWRALLLLCVGEEQARRFGNRGLGSHVFVLDEVFEVCLGYFNVGFVVDLAGKVTEVVKCGCSDSGCKETCDRENVGELHFVVTKEFVCDWAGLMRC